MFNFNYIKTVVFVCLCVSSIKSKEMIMIDMAQAIFEDDSGIYRIKFNVEKELEAKIQITGIGPKLIKEIRHNGTQIGKIHYLMETRQSKFAEKVEWEAILKTNDNLVEFKLTDGLQIARVEETSIYKICRLFSDLRVLVEIDLNGMIGHGYLSNGQKEYPNILFDNSQVPIFYFSNRIDQYADYIFTQKYKVTDIICNNNSCTLVMELFSMDDRLNVVYELTIENSIIWGNGYKLSNRQSLQLLEDLPEKSLNFKSASNLQFFHAKVAEAYGKDWSDGQTDYFWNRQQSDNLPHTLAGSYIYMQRLFEPGNRTIKFWNPTNFADKTIYTSAPYSTSFAWPLESQNSIGGWFGKTGSGSIKFCFERYEGNFRGGISPLISHCGHGADTHFYAFWNHSKQYYPFGMKHKNDWLDIKYNLFFLESVPTREQIEDFNLAHLYFFGSESEQRSPIVSWIGNVNAIGLVHEDGSVYLLGIDGHNIFVTLPEETIRNVKSIEGGIFRLPDHGLFDVMNRLIDTKIQISKGEQIVINCGSRIK